jgi:hypothetical protein
MVLKMMDFSSESMRARKQWNIFKVMRELSTSILYPAKIFFRNEGEVKIFSNEGKLRELIDKKKC